MVLLLDHIWVAVVVLLCPRKARLNLEPRLGLRAAVEEWHLILPTPVTRQEVWGRKSVKVYPACALWTQQTGATHLSSPQAVRARPVPVP